MPSILENFRTVDIVFCTALIIAFLAGTLRGASGEIARLVSLVCGLLTNYIVYKTVISMFGAGQMLAFGVALLATILVAMLTHRIVGRSLRLILGQPADAIAGAVMAVLGTFLVLAVLWCGIAIFTPRSWYDDYLADSHAEKFVHPLVEKIQQSQLGKND